MGKPPFERARDFIEGWNLLSQKQKQDVIHTLDLYREEPNHPTLRKHNLRGRHPSVFSISVSDNLRIILRERGQDSVALLDVGNHDRVYGE